MSIDKNLAAWQILGVAIRSEVDAAAFYSRLQARVKNVPLGLKLKFLALEEEHHKTILEKLLAQKYPGKPLDAPESSLMPPIGVSLPSEPGVPALFEAALKAEESAESYYNEASERVEDEAGRKILAYLGRVERSHQFMIRSELELIQKFPDYYDVEDFHIGQDLFHVGP
ncbi:MAG: ferritin family protein [Candidatus Aminicenantes bacterium]|nr:ferritin family protein [Candidatus Aminicenantes bacterium]NTV81074.1 ferritin family protein [Candidatus Aminicenantes bacterium]